MDLITNRTALDVERWKLLHDKGWASMTADEQQEWLGEMKGRYNYTDMNRVETAVNTLSVRLRELGYIHPTLTVKMDWSRWSCPTRADMQRYYGNVETLRGACPIYKNTPATPTVSQKLNYVRANNLEKILSDIDEITTSIPKAWHYAGEIFSGEV